MIHVCILGPGLIGGSLGMALRRVRKNKKRKYFVSGWSRNSAHLIRAKKLGALDVFFSQAEKAVNDADVIILATPIQYFHSILKEISKSIKPGAVIADAGSVKSSVLKDIRGALSKRKDVDIVGCHPLAGSEKSGIEFATPSLFQKSICVICDGDAQPKSISRIRSLWKDVGAACLTLSPSDHDRLVAFTSHLPHLIAFAMISLLLKSRTKDKSVMSLLGGSFRDATRVAASNAPLWAGIVDANRTDIKKATALFTKEISMLVASPASRLRQTLEILSRHKKSW